jgi:ketosteroid isomerase-like protein
MRYCLLVVFGMILACPLIAQEWSDEEQEVLDHLEECWDMWMDGVEQGTPDRWMSECTTPETTYWSAVDTAPTDHEYIRRIWDRISETDLGWLDIRPTSLRVNDDIAVLHFYGQWRAATPDGETVTEGKRTEIFQRLDGRWKIIAQHWSPVTPADAEPYQY